MLPGCVSRPWPERAGRRPMVIHRSRVTHRLVVVAKVRARIMVLVGQVMVVVPRMVGDR